MVTKPPGNKPSTDTEPIRRLKSAEKMLVDDDEASSVEMPGSVEEAELDSDMMSIIKQQLKDTKISTAQHTARSARNIAKKDALESEIELLETRKKKELLDNPPSSQGPRPGGSGVLGGLGVGGRYAGIQAILQYLSPEDRAAFIKENKDLIFNSDPLLSQIANPRSTPAPSSGSALDIINGIIALKEDERAEKLLSQRLDAFKREQQSNSPPSNSPPPGGVTVADVLSLVKTMQDSSNSNIEKIMNSFTSSFTAMQNEMKEMRLANSTVQQEMQKSLLDAREKLISKEQEERDAKIMKLIEELKQQRSPRGIDLEQIPQLFTQLKNAGMGFKPENDLDKATELEYDLKHKELELEEAERARRHEEKIAAYNASTEKTKLLQGMISKGLEGFNLSKKFKEGSGTKSGQAVAGRMAT